MLVEIHNSARQLLGYRLNDGLRFSDRMAPLIRIFRDT